MVLFNVIYMDIHCDHGIVAGPTLLLMPSPFDLPGRAIRNNSLMQFVIIRTLPFTLMFNGIYNGIDPVMLINVIVGTM